MWRIGRCSTLRTNRESPPKMPQSAYNEPRKPSARRRNRRAERAQSTDASIAAARSRAAHAAPDRGLKTRTTFRISDCKVSIGRTSALLKASQGAGKTKEKAKTNRPSTPHQTETAATCCGDCNCTNCSCECVNGECRCQTANCKCGCGACGNTR